MAATCGAGKDPGEAYHGLSDIEDKKVTFEELARTCRSQNCLLPLAARAHHGDGTDSVAFAEVDAAGLQRPVCL